MTPPVPPSTPTIRLGVLPTLSRYAHATICQSRLSLCVESSYGPVIIALSPSYYASRSETVNLTSVYGLFLAYTYYPCLADSI